MHRATFPIVAIAFTIAAASAHAQDVPGESNTGESNTDAPPERLIGLLEELAGELEKAGVAEDIGPEAPVDCDAVAAALDSWTQDHADELGGLVTSVDAYLDDLPRDEVRGLETRMAPYVDAVVVAAIDCASHDATMAALDSMDAVLSSDSSRAE